MSGIAELIYMGMVEGYDGVLHGADGEHPDGAPASTDEIVRMTSARALITLQVAALSG